MFFPLKDHNPTRRPPVVTIALIVANFVVFGMEIFQGAQMGAFIARWGATPYELTNLEDLVGTAGPLLHVQGPSFLPITALTSMFLHGGWIHLLFNLHFLWIFGNNVEDLLGHAKYLLFYVATGLLGLLMHILTDPNSPVPTVGASGAISGVMGAYLVAYPNARVTSLLTLGFFIQFIEVRAVFLIGFWIGLQILMGVVGLGATTGGGTAYWAHIGGFIAGWIGIKLIARRQLAHRNWAKLWSRPDRSTYGS